MMDVGAILLIRALLFAADYLSETRPTPEREKKTKTFQDRSGKAWSQNEDFELRIGFERQETCSTYPVGTRDREGRSLHESFILV